MELLVVGNLLKIIVSIVLWMAIGQTLLLAVIYFKLKAILATRKQGDNNSDKKGNATNSGVKE